MPIAGVFVDGDVSPKNRPFEKIEAYQLILAPSSARSREACRRIPYLSAVKTGATNPTIRSTSRSPPRILKSTARRSFIRGLR
jgi:hypothetical protein